MASKTHVTIGAKTIRYEALVWLHQGTWVAEAWPLEIVTQGESEDDARRMLDEALTLFLEVSAEHGQLEEILEEASYEVQDGIFSPPDMHRFPSSLSFKA